MPEITSFEDSVEHIPSIAALTEHISLSLGEEAWDIQWVLSASHPYVVTARLRFGTSTREGMAEHQNLQYAKQLALYEAWQYFGFADESPATTAQQQPETNHEDQKPEAHQHIDDMLERCKEAGLGKEAIKLVMMGYGKTIEESRQIYKNLRLLLKQHGHD